LTEAALEVVPAVGGFVVDGVWAGLRPAAPDRHPIVGWAPGIDRLMLATAHYRNGVLLGPLTGQRVANMLLRGTTAAEFEPFGPQRFVPTRDELLANGQEASGRVPGVLDAPAG
jgi:glycine oxidase